MTPSFPTTIRVLSAVLFASAFLQLAANLRIIAVSRETLIRAAQTGPWPIILILALSCIFALLVSVFKRRSLWWINGALLVYIGLSAWILRSYEASILALIYFGETALYHYNSLLAAAIAILIPWKWAQDTTHHRRIQRLLPGLAAAVGSITLVVAHVDSLPGFDLIAKRSLWHATGAGFLLVASPIALGCYWKKIESSHLRLAIGFFSLPWIVRVAVVGPAGLAGERVPSSSIIFVGTSIVISALAIAILVRPRIPLAQRISSGTLSLFFCLVLLVYYRGRFGEIEDNFDGLSRAIFGFSIPYPAYVMDWQTTALLTGIFFISALTMQCLMSVHDRNRGLAFGLYAMAGIGLTSPNLALLLGVGSLLFIDSAIDSGSNEANQEKSPLLVIDRQSMHEALQQIATQLQLPAPLHIIEGRREIEVIRGKLDGIDLDLRMSFRKSDSASLKIQMGIETKYRPPLALIPDRSQRGTRPAHLLARSHRIKGLPRMMESVREELLDALLELPTAKVELWPARAEITLPQLSEAPPVDIIVKLLRQVIEQMPEFKVGLA